MTTNRFWYLVDERDDSLSAQTGVLLVIGLFIALVLLHGPVGHLQKAHQCEDVGKRDLQI